MLGPVIEEFYGRYGNVTKQYQVPLSRILSGILYTDYLQWQPSTDQTL